VLASCLSDIIFVVDASGSTTSSNFALVKSFLSQLVGGLDVDRGTTRVGVVTFSSSVGPGFFLSTYTSVTSLQSVISQLSYLGGNTNTAAALSFVRTSMLTSAAGDRSNAPNVVILLTYGQTSAAQVCTVLTLSQNKLRTISVTDTNLDNIADGWIHSTLHSSELHFSAFLEPLLIIDSPRLLASALVSGFLLEEEPFP